jgi:hypothetical protein
MSNIFSRLKKIEEKLVPRKKTVVILSCSDDDDDDDNTGDFTSTVTINNRNYKIPENVDPYKFIKEKTKMLSGYIVCLLCFTKKK